MLVATSRVSVAVISPHYCHRYWPMRELDIALHEPPVVRQEYWSGRAARELPELPMVHQAFVIIGRYMH